MTEEKPGLTPEQQSALPPSLSQEDLHRILPVFTGTHDRGLKWHLLTFIRQVLVAIVTASLILAILIIGFRGQNERDLELRERNLKASLSIACILAIPPDVRTEVAVVNCFEQNGLPAPSFGKGGNDA